MSTLNPHQFWHVSPRRNRESIQRTGLDPLHDSEPEDREEGLGVGTWMYAGNAKGRARVLAQGVNGPNSSDVWQIHPHGHDIEHGSEASSEWHPDDPVHVTWDHISPEHLRRVKFPPGPAR